MMMTSGAFSSSRTRSSVARPSMPGSQMSSKTTSKLFRASVSRQVSPLPTDCTLYCSSSRTPVRESRIPGSSSTMRMLDMRCGHVRHALGGDGQLNHKACAHWLVLFHANGTVMIFHNPAYDCQAQPGAAFLGREIGHEQALLGLLGDALPGIGNADFDSIAAGH